MGRSLNAWAWAGVKSRQLLKILLLERGRVVSKDRLADLIWGEDLPQWANATIEA
jgi:DNA-binding SARP family transcriptional activator